MEKVVCEIKVFPVKLDQLLKLSGLALSGGEAGRLADSGLVKVNGNTVAEKRKKITADDRVVVFGKYLLVWSREI
jgi:ribosome-associated protein YbcJ (S4-like RNA binding protein)